MRGADLIEAKSQTVWKACLSVFGVTGCSLNELVGTSGFGVQISVESPVFDRDHSIKERNFLGRRFRRELYHGMKSITEVHEMVKIIRSMW